MFEKAKLSSLKASQKLEQKRPLQPQRINQKLETRKNKEQRTKNKEQRTKIFGVLGSNLKCIT
jgi:hypothetical protein